MASIEEKKLLKELVNETAVDLFIDKNVKLEFHHYDSYLKMVLIKELEDSESPVTYEMLEPLKGKIREKINKRWHISILHTDIKAWEAAQGGNDGTIL